MGVALSYSALTVTFHACHLDSEEFGSDQDHMVSRLEFSFVFDGEGYSGCYVNLKQPVGSDYSTARLEVSRPQGAAYRGPWNQGDFAAVAEVYYHTCQIAIVQMSRSGVDGRPQDCRVDAHTTCELDVSGRSPGW